MNGDDSVERYEERGRRGQLKKSLEGERFRFYFSHDGMSLEGF